MSDVMAPLATVTALPAQGMITIRGNLKDAGFIAAVKSASGLDVPAQRQIVTQEELALAWMSPDELLLLCGYEDAPVLSNAMTEAFGDQFAMAVVVSDARAVFDIEGPKVRDVLGKLAPVDMAPGSFGHGEIRRTRLAQVAAAFWLTRDDSARLVCFRSVAQYAEDLLKTSAKPGTEVGYF